MISRVPDLVSPTFQAVASPGGAATIQTPTGIDSGKWFSGLAVCSGGQGGTVWTVTNQKGQPIGQGQGSAPYIGPLFVAPGGLLTITVTSAGAAAALSVTLYGFIATDPSALPTLTPGAGAASLAISGPVTATVSGSVAINNTPNVNIGNSGTVAIGNTPNVGITAGSVQIKDAAGNISGNFINLGHMSVALATNAVVNLTPLDINANSVRLGHLSFSLDSGATGFVSLQVNVVNVGWTEVWNVDATAARYFTASFDGPWYSCVTNDFGIRIQALAGSFTIRGALTYTRTEP